MNRWIAAWLWTGIAFASAQPSPSATPAAGATAGDAPGEATSATSPDNTPYLAKPDLLAACDARLKAQDDKPCDIMFIGDSATERWENTGQELWDKLYAPRHALNFGVEGDKTQNVLWRLSNMDVQSLKPKVVVLLIGTNNLANSSHEISDGIRSIIVNLEADFAGVKIILVSILPSERATDKMRQVNTLIGGNADDSSVFYLDLVSKMPTVPVTAADGKVETAYKGIGPDRLNPDAKGYQIWADAMEPLLTKLLGK